MEMEFASDLILDMPLGRVDLFPECFLNEGLTKDEPVDVFKDLIQSGDTSSFQPGLGADDVFPDWMDLKMDFSVLEDLEEYGTVLDDLLQSEVGYDQVTTGQLPDLLSSATTENQVLPPLGLEQFPCETDGKLTPPPLGSVNLDIQSELLSPAPSTPDWIVPDAGDPDSPTSSFSPISEAASPGYTLVEVESPPPMPTPVESPVLTFVTPIAQPVSLVDAGELILDTQAVSLDNILSLSVFLSAVNESSPVSTEPSSESSLPPSPVPTLDTPKGQRKRKAATNRKPRAPKSHKLVEEKIEEQSLVAPVSKKDRKRKQNKDAAMRYRMKKRVEGDTLADEEGELLEINWKLKDKVQQISSELGYLKNLMKEMFKARGLLKS